MEGNTSILLGDYYDSFVNEQVKTGKFASASEVIRIALRLFEESETAKKNLVKELRKGEQSGIATVFDPDKFIASLHKKYIKK